MTANRIDPPDELSSTTAERQWITMGPNSGGVGGWWLYRGHMFRFEHDGPTGSVERGIPTPEWIEHWGERHPEIAEELRTRDG